MSARALPPTSHTHQGIPARPAAQSLFAQCPPGAQSASAVQAFARWLSDHEGDFDATAILSARAPRHQKPLPRPLDEDAARAVTQQISDDKAEQYYDYLRTEIMPNNRLTACLEKVRAWQGGPSPN